MEVTSSNLPVGPFRAWLADFIEAHGSQLKAATVLGIDAGQLSRLRAADAVSVRTADRVFVRAGDPGALARLYPLDVSADERWCNRCAELVGVDGQGRCLWCIEPAETTIASLALAGG